MKAVVWTRYGPPGVLRLQEAEKPEPKDDEVLIRVHASTVTTGDCDIRRLKLPLLFRLPLRIFLGLRKPKRLTILGQELAGEVEAVGRAVTRFKPGDQVFAPTFFRFGGYAEYACLPEKYPVLKPANMTYEEAATLPIGGVYGMHFVRATEVRSGQRVVIYGAGGSIGTYAVQLAKSLGAEVTAVDSAEKLLMLRSIGADHVFDYRKEDFTRSGRTYDAIIDVVGKSPYSRSIRSLKPDGRYLLGNFTLSGFIRAPWTSLTSTKRVLFDQPRFNAETYVLLKQLIETGKTKAIIDRCYPLERTAEAHRYVEQGHKKGSVVITVGQDDKA